MEAVYLDFKKVFDTVPHQELLYKLWLSGITGPLWRWFQCYLLNRQHFTCIDGVASACLPVSSGVPQGSILGPLLFIFYTNDLPSNLQSPVYMFADDTKLLRVITSFNDNVELQSDLDSISEWCNLWKLNLNESKCSSLFFSLWSSTGPSFAIKDSPVDQASTHRDLGIIVSADLSWSHHISKVRSLAYNTLYFVRRNVSVQPSSPSAVLKSLYVSLVWSKFLYFCQLWSPRSLKDITRLETVQRRATRFMVPLSHCLDYKGCLTELQLLPLMYYYDLQDLLFLIKCLLNPPDNFNILQYISFSSHGTRSTTAGKLKVNYRCTSTTQHF